MIRYPDALEQIEPALDAEAKGWLARAGARTKLFDKNGKYTEEMVDSAGKKKALPPFWSEVKPVYMRRQFNKCVYCETKLEGKKDAYVQWDLEHFRPKSAVRKWPHEKSVHRYDFDTGDEASIGYHLLAYHPYNYAAACKTCNSPYKSDYFPIASTRLSGRWNPGDYATENPFLVYPLGVGETDPEDLISFVGEQAEPKYKQTDDLLKWRRGRVMIDFFGLNRDGLVCNRAAWLRYAVWPNVGGADRGDPDALKAIERIRSKQAQFTNCSKCFLELCRTDRSVAERMIPDLEEIVRQFEE
ncbi:MAG: hypothetical protein JWL77_391 [Chthonomonadaceae bacterium]|nr:hypothetical protein [Chthonomonadaceae bacterium]